MPYPAIYAFTDEAGASQAAMSIKSWFAADLDLAEAASIVAFMRSAPHPGVMTQLRVLGGAMSRVAPEATAFAQRDAEVLVAAMALFDGLDGAARADYRTGALAAAFADSATGVYSNFLGDEGDVRIRSAYPHGAYERLAAVKQRHDPANLFRRNQNVASA